MFSQWSVSLLRLQLGHFTHSLFYAALWLDKGPSIITESLNPPKILGGGPKQITNTSLIIHVDYASDLTYPRHLVRVAGGGLKCFASSYISSLDLLQSQSLTQLACTFYGHKNRFYISASEGIAKWVDRILCRSWLALSGPYAKLKPVEELGATAIILLCCTVRANLSPGFHSASALTPVAAPRWDE